MPFALAAIPLLVVMFALTAYAMAELSRYHAHGIAGWIQTAIGTILKAIFLTPLQIIGLTKWLSHQFGAAFLTSAYRVAGFFVGLNSYALTLQGVALRQMAQVLSFGQRIVYHEIPLQVRARVQPLVRAEQAIQHEVLTHTKTIVKVEKSIPAVAHRVAVVTVPKVAIPHVQEWEWLHRHWKALVAAVAGAGVLGYPSGLGLQDTIAAIKKRLKSLEKYGVGAAAVGAVGYALSRLGLGGGRCNNTDKALKRLCGLDPNLLESILADTLAVFGTISIVELAKGMQVLTPAARWGIGGLIREAPSEFENVPQDALDAALALIPGL